MRPVVCLALPVLFAGAGTFGETLYRADLGQVPNGPAYTRSHPGTRSTPWCHVA